MTRDRFSVEVEFERYARLENRENCWLLNPVIRDTMRIVEFLSLTRYEPVHADDIALFTRLPEAFVIECLANLAFDQFIRETELGFQCYLGVEKLTRHTDSALDQIFDSYGVENVRVRDASGEWPGGNSS